MSNSRYNITVFSHVVQSSVDDESHPNWTRRGTLIINHTGSVEEIVFQNTEKNKVRQLLMTLLRRGHIALTTFGEALRDSDCEELADLLVCE